MIGCIKLNGEKSRHAAPSRLRMQNLIEVMSRERQSEWGIPSRCSQPSVVNLKSEYSTESN